MCDMPLPTASDRQKHMQDTQHCRCGSCGGYMPPGGVREHMSARHAGEPWDSDEAAGADRQMLQDAMPWVREEYEQRSRDSGGGGGAAAAGAGPSLPNWAPGPRGGAQRKDEAKEEARAFAEDICGEIFGDGAAQAPSLGNFTKGGR